MDHFNGKCEFSKQFSSENLKLKASKKRSLTNICRIGLATLIMVIAMAGFALAVVAFIELVSFNKKMR